MHQGFSPEHRDFFYRHFPQWKGKLHKEQEKMIQDFIGDFTMCSDATQAWTMIESNLMLMFMFYGFVHDVINPGPQHQKRHLMMWLIGFVTTLATALTFQDKIPSEYVSGLSALIGAMAIILKNKWKAYTQSCLKKQALTQEGE